MSEFRSFSLSDVTDVDEDPEGFVRDVREAGDETETRSRVHCVRWSPQNNDIVVMKEVHLWEEDTVTTDVHAIAARINQLQSSTRGTASASCFVQYLALHVDTPHHYQWLLSRCGPSLRTLLDRRTTLPCFNELCVKQILRCVLTALHHLHSVCAFVHGDVSLGNIFTRLSFQEDSTVSLGDLEVLAPLGAEPDGSPGTLLYTSPERLQGDSLPHSAQDDVWAFGIVAYQLLTGNSKAHPWCGDHTPISSPDSFWTLLDAMHQARDLASLAYLQETSLAESCPEALPVVATCLAWEPRDRPSAAALLQHPWLSV
ncbi:putative protein kinase [Leptomonas pyrrhocoris]|uniref:Protein kinase domain-containing protein n=1 Tax=Leptomonas pyrrhocoris TaxID=157538 RepID=A0A0M9G611_LEPPY|nr:putative protein kinase [Leptomonas pyrrhocoris]KPA82929.1 putative protein kinase [Leptomonas pyrrhocoris]|eukprot:XP_015661368.1 putative protein kinase [Leptomonas pyrrhocoris]